MALIFCSKGKQIVEDKAQIAYINTSSFSITLPVGMNWTMFGVFYLSPDTNTWKKNILFQACTASPLAPSIYCELEVSAEIDTGLPRRLRINHGGVLDAYAVYWTTGGSVLPDVSLQPGTVYASTFGATFFKFDIWANLNPYCCEVLPPDDPPCGKLTETLCYDKQQDCCNDLSYDNPIYLGWYNSLGGWETWLFDCIYTNSVQTKTVDKFTRYFNDIANQDRRSLSTRKTAIQQSALTSYLVTRDEAVALEEIYYSPIVKIWKGVDSVGDDIWLVVNVVDSTSVITNTGITLQQFTLTIEYPELFTISN